MRRLIANAAVLALATLGCLALLEAASRWLRPTTLSSEFVSADSGEPVDIISEDYPRLRPNLRVRHVSSEFDAHISTTADGYRGPEPDGAPDTLFLGDSFTFGWGISDGDTFVARFCAAARLRCANLGRHGSGTWVQMDVLEEFLFREGWRPERVYLVFWGMSTSFTSGNDFMDNVLESERAQQAELPNIEVRRDGLGVRVDGKPVEDLAVETFRGLTLAERIVLLRIQVLRASNLARIVYTRLAPTLRATFAPRPAPRTRNRAFELTRAQLERFARLGRRYEFEPVVAVIHPMQDILGGTAPETFETVRALAPDLRCVPTFTALTEDTVRYYYATDAHFNVAGAARIADVLLQDWRAQR